jgi:hypothetical protein
MTSDPFAQAPGYDDDDFEVPNDEANQSQTPEGVYVVQVMDVGKSVSKAGNDMYEWTFHIVCDEKGSADYAGEELKVFTALSAAALWKLEETTVALGLGKAGERGSFKRSDALGRQALAACKNQEYNGRTRLNIVELRAHPKGAGYRTSVPKATPQAVGDVPF